MEEEEARGRVGKHPQQPSHKNRAKSQMRGSHKETKVRLKEEEKERGIQMRGGEERGDGGDRDTCRSRGRGKKVGRMDEEAARNGGRRETLEGSMKKETGEGEKGIGSQAIEAEEGGTRGRGGGGAMTEAMTTTLMTGSGQQGKDRVGETAGRGEGGGEAGVRTGMHHTALPPGIGEVWNGKTTGIWDMEGGAEDCSVGENFHPLLEVSSNAFSSPQSKPTAEGPGGTLQPSI